MHAWLKSNLGKVRISGKFFSADSVISFFLFEPFFSRKCTVYRYGQGEALKYNNLIVSYCLGVPENL